MQTLCIFSILYLKRVGKWGGVSQGSVISPLLSNIYLNEVDKMLDKAKEVTQTGQYNYVEYAAVCRMTW